MCFPERVNFMDAKMTTEFKPSTALDALASKIGDRTALIGVVGLGYVGLPSLDACCRAGFTRLGFDVDRHKVDTRNATKDVTHGRDKIWKA
jgi:molybdopterin/thiamine biosynthesis adenylyltransferase